MKNAIAEAMFDISLVALTAIVFSETHSLYSFFILGLVYTGKRGHYGDEYGEDRTKRTKE